MLGEIGILLIVVIAMVSFLSIAHTQAEQKVGKKTFTFPNGDLILDLNGKWDVINENYGPWGEYGVYPNIHKITQTGSSIVGILMKNDRLFEDGCKYIMAELDGTGFMKVEIYTNLGMLKAKGQVSEDGNKIVIDDGEKFKMTLTRK